MQLIFDSLTGNVRRLTLGVHAEWGSPLVPLDVKAAAPTGPYLLLTYTFGSGEVPPSTAAFLARHAAGLRGVVACGSYHWGPHFARAADRISAQYGVPVVARVNKAGTAADRAVIVGWLRAQGVLAPAALPPAAAALTPPEVPTWNAG